MNQYYNLLSWKKTRIAVSSQQETGTPSHLDLIGHLMLPVKFVASLSQFLANSLSVTHIIKGFDNYSITVIRLRRPFGNSKVLCDEEKIQYCIIDRFVNSSHKLYY